MIKEPLSKTRAEIDFFPNTANMYELAEIWCLPFIKNHLVRVTTGICNFEELKVHNTYNRKLFDLPEETNEVLLWRQVRRTGAKAIHIFKNSNNNSKRSATVYFKNEEDYINSTKYMIFYFNTRLSWANKKAKTIESRITETEERKIPHDRVYKRKLNRDI